MCLVNLLFLTGMVAVIGHGREFLFGIPPLGGVSMPKVVDTGDLRFLF